MIKNIKIKWKCFSQIKCIGSLPMFDKINLKKMFISSIYSKLNLRQMVAFCRDFAEYLPIARTQVPIRPSGTRPCRTRKGWEGSLWTKCVHAVAPFYVCRLSDRTPQVLDWDEPAEIAGLILIKRFNITVIVEKSERFRSLNICLLISPPFFLKYDTVAIEKVKVFLLESNRLILYLKRIHVGN